jgi:hypothetical protein
MGNSELVKLTLSIGMGMTWGRSEIRRPRPAIEPYAAGFQKRALSPIPLPDEDLQNGRGPRGAVDSRAACHANVPGEEMKTAVECGATISWYAAPFGFRERIARF